CTKLRPACAVECGAEHLAKKLRSVDAGLLGDVARDTRRELFALRFDGVVGSHCVRAPNRLPQKIERRAGCHRISAAHPHLRAVTQSCNELVAKARLSEAGSCLDHNGPRRVVFDALLENCAELSELAVAPHTWRRPPEQCTHGLIRLTLAAQHREAVDGCEREALFEK